ncbi:MAG: SRPBCC domain-containing protein [candidate division Zixibacteria bacterium]|nr:SRPBCC domain-containing protein [candidate division Zixibacteria bacterium]
MTDRSLINEVTVDASLDDVWAAWTTTEGAQKFFSPNVDIDLRIGGRYEIYFDMDAAPGSRGSEGCRVLSYLPMQMLSYEWNAPPSIPSLRDADKKTWVVMQFEVVGETQTRIRHTLLGIGEGEDWDRYYEYFERAWPYVLANCRKRFAAG